MILKVLLNENEQELLDRLLTETDTVVYCQMADKISQVPIDSPLISNLMHHDGRIRIKTARIFKNESRIVQLCQQMVDPQDILKINSVVAQLINEMKKGYNKREQVFVVLTAFGLLNSRYDNT